MKSQLIVSFAVLAVLGSLCYAVLCFTIILYHNPARVTTHPTNSDTYTCSRACSCFVLMGMGRGLWWRWKWGVEMGGGNGGGGRVRC